MDSSVHIRPMLEPDVALVTEIVQDTPLRLSEADIKKYLVDARKYFSFVSIINEDIAGFILGWSMQDEAEIHYVVTKSRFRRKGVAQALFDFTCRHLAQSKIEKLFLEVNKNNLPALSFYKKNKFQQINCRRGYYSDGSDAIILQKLFDD